MKLELAKKILDAIYQSMKDEPRFVAVHAEANIDKPAFSIVFSKECLEDGCRFEDVLGSGPDFKFKRSSAGLREGSNFVLEMLDYSWDVSLKAGSPIALFDPGETVEKTSALGFSDHLEGGDSVRNKSVGRGRWGTVALAVKNARFAGEGGSYVKRALVSANHVLAALDRGSKGDDIEVEFEDGWNIAGRLHSKRSVVDDDDPKDVALAEINMREGGKYGIRYNYIRVIHDVDPATQVGIPTRKIKVCKYGAKSKYTEGDYEGLSTVMVKIGDKRVAFRNLLRFSPGFACHGDSGAAVVIEKDRKLLGLLVAAELKKCEDKPVSYAIPWEDLGLEFEKEEN